MFGVPGRTAPEVEFLLAAGTGAPRSRAAHSARGRAVAAQAMPLVHVIASSLRVDRSLATAIRFAARHLGGPAGEELERLEWAVRIRHFSTVEDGFMALANRIGPFDLELKRALLTLQGAETEPTREGLERRLDRAYDIVVRAEERRRERMASTLDRPITTLFGMGVVLPLVLASLFPMIQMASPGVGAGPLALMLLVALPATIFLGAAHILERNTLGTSIGAPLRRVAALCALLPAAAGAAAWSVASFVLPGGAVPLSLAVAAAVASAGATSGLALHRHASGREAEESALGSDLPDLLHATGSRMVAGRSAEQSLLDAVDASPASRLSAKLRGVLFDVIVGRRSLEQALERDTEVSGTERVFPALRLLATAASRDTANAGRVVLHLAEFERLRQEAAESTRTRVRAIVETTRATVAFFAPLILGITAGMFGLLSRITTASLFGGGAAASALDAASFSALVAVYLALQIALVDWFGARLLSPTPASTLGKNLARDMPVGLALFAVAQVAATALF